MRQKTKRTDLKPERDSTQRCGLWRWRKEASSHGVQQRPVGAGTDARLTTSKKAGHSVTDLKELNSVNKLSEQKMHFPLQPLQRDRLCPVIFGLVRAVQDL